MIFVSTKGSECIKWFRIAYKPVRDEDGELMKSPLLLFDSFLRKGIQAIFRGYISVDDPEDEFLKCQKSRKSKKKVRALCFQFQGIF